MTYALVIPPEYLGDLVAIREESGKSIRKQILESIQNHISKTKEDKENNAPSLSFLEKKKQKSPSLILRINSLLSVVNTVIQKLFGIFCYAKTVLQTIPRS